jgi:hypothetical protein
MNRADPHEGPRAFVLGVSAPDPNAARPLKFAANFWKKYITFQRTAVVHEAVRCSLGGEHSISKNCFRDYGIYVSTQTDDDFAYVISYVAEENLVIGTDYGHCPR